MTTPRTGALSVILLMLILLAACTPASAGVFEGNIFTDLYGFKAQDTTHLRSYMGLHGRGLIWQGADHRQIEFQTDFRYSTDLPHVQVRDPKFFVRQSYIRFVGLPSRSQFSLGRQFVFNSLHAVLIDGFSAEYTIRRNMAIDLFGGSAVSSVDPQVVRDLPKYATAGAGFGLGSTREMGRIGIVWFYQRDRGYLAAHQVGLNLERMFSEWSLYGKGSYNLVQNRLADLTGRLSVRPRDWYISAEYRYREPWVSNATLFGIIDFDCWQQTRFEARRVVWKTVSFGGQLQYSFLKSEDSWRILLGINSSHGSFGWSHQEGNGTYSDGIYGSLSTRVTTSLEVYGNSNLSRYRVQPEQTDRSDSYGSALGLYWRAPSGFSLRAEGQWFRNAVVTSQTRFYLKIAKDLSIGSSTKGEKQ